MFHAEDIHICKQNLLEVECTGGKRAPDLSRPAISFYVNSGGHRKMKNEGGGGGRSFTTILHGAGNLVLK